MMVKSGNGILLDPLTERELEILHLLAEGLTNREIGQKLRLTLETIKWYNRQIYSKLDAGSRVQAVARGRQLGLFDEPGQAVRPASPSLHNLPAELSSFVGRQREIAAVQQLLHTSRLVTLTGPGGVGKTRLGLHVAASVVDHYPDGVFFVSLLTATNDAQVPKAIAQTLGLVERANQPLAATLQRYFQNKEMLLLLDNFEHVMAAVSLLTALLAAAPRLTLLVTSREALQLTGEYEYLVPPLTLPDAAWAGEAGGLSAAESVTLFVQRARAASSTFHLTGENAAAVAGICLRLDGLPLALELAAARIRLFSPQQLLERLHDRLGLLVAGPRDLPDRQRTLRDTIDWSYNLLSEDEKTLFARLAVFRNGCSLEAVEAVCGFAPVGDALNGLASLLDKSLLYQEVGPAGTPRFYMLETIHEYAHERLVHSDMTSRIRERHLDFFLSWAEEIQPGYRQHEQFQLLAQTESEWSNLRLAFNWALDNANIEAAARLITAVNYFLRYKSHLVEGYRMMDRLRNQLDQLPKIHRIRFLIAAERLAHNNGEVEKSAKYAHQALELAREQQDEELLAWALIAVAANSFEDYRQSTKLARESLHLFRELGHKAGMAAVLNVLGITGKINGYYEEAKEALEEGLRLSQETGEIIRQTMILSNFTAVAYMEENYQKAKDMAILNTRKRMAMEWWEWAGIGLVELAGPIAKLGEPEKAARLLGASASTLAGIGIDYQSTQKPEVSAYMVDVKSQLGQAVFTAIWAEGEAMTLRQAVAYAVDE